MKVKLQDVVDGIQYSNAKSQFFYYTVTGEVVMLMDSVYGIGQDKALMAGQSADGPDRCPPGTLHASSE